MKRGLFITIEGTDGAGKSTQIDFIKRYLKEKEIDVIFTREPGGTEISEKIRKIILDKSNKEMTPMTETLLYAASRAQLMEEVIKPSLKEGKTIVCDRFIDSSIAYQGYARKLGKQVQDINEYAIGEYMPDLTILLKVDVKRGIERIEENAGNKEEKDRLENENIEFHKEVFKGYMQLEQDFKDRIKGVDAEKPIEEVSSDIKKYLDILLKDRYEL